MRRTYTTLLLSTFATLCIACSVRAQIACDSSGVVRRTELSGPGEDYARLVELTVGAHISPRISRRLSSSEAAACQIGPWDSGVPYTKRLESVVTVVPLSFLSSYNSAYPEDRNNGALWSGRGMSAALGGGIVFIGGPLSVGFVPVVTYQQNRSYQLLPPFIGTRSVYSSGLYAGLDAPQRFGSQPYSSFDLGQSYVRLTFGKFAMGFSKENVWWGPGVSNAILFTNTAPGFPHLFLNLTEPTSIGIGKLGVEALWGRLSESKYFDTNPANDHRMIVGAVLTLEPKWTPGLFLGFGRTFLMPWDSISGRNLFPLGRGFVSKGQVTPSNPSGNTNDDQRLSLMGRYVLPESGFELYGEWAREDAAWDWSDFFQEPEHSSGHVIGAQKLFTPSATRWIRLYSELTNLQELRQDRPAIRPAASFYVHGPQGHTQLGQLLGASIGPGSESQFIGIDVFTAGGLVGGYFERVRRDEFSALGIPAWSTTWPPRHDVELTAGVRFTRQVGQLRVDTDIARSKRFNRNFIRTESNTRLQLSLVWVGLY
jgi:hypothetical protein